MNKNSEERREFLEKFLLVSGVGAVYSLGLTGCPAPGPTIDRLTLYLSLKNSRFNIYGHFIPINFKQSSFYLLLENDLFGSGGDNFTKNANNFAISMVEKNSNKEILLDTIVLNNKKDNQQIKINLKDNLKYNSEYLLNVYSKDTKKTKTFNISTTAIVLDKYVLSLQQNQTEYLELKGVWVNDKLVTDNIKLLKAEYQNGIEIEDDNLIKVTKTQELEAYDIKAYIQNSKQELFNGTIFIA